MVLEWMDTDLWKARMHPRSQDPKLQKLVARSILEALAVFVDIQETHTDINPNNVLISGIETSTPVIKLADLGNLCGEGIDWVRLQGLAIRAPEVWSGLGCWPASDVWSLGVTVCLTRPDFTALADNFQMAHWLAKPPIFGASDKVVEGLTESWCIAKVKRLVGPLSPSCQA
jgi:serine/threonine protein kinase